MACGFEACESGVATRTRLHDKEEPRRGGLQECYSIGLSESQNAYVA